MPASQEISASPDVKINIGFLPETLFHWYKRQKRQQHRSSKLFSRLVSHTLRSGRADAPKNGLDGARLKSGLSGGALPKRHEPMIGEFNGYGGIIAIRDSKWKALCRGLKKKQPQRWELYNLATDREEKHNIAAKHPEIVQRLEKSWLKSRTVEPDFPIAMDDEK